MNFAGLSLLQLLGVFGAASAVATALYVSNCADEHLPFRFRRCGNGFWKTKTLRRCSRD